MKNKELIELIQGIIILIALLSVTIISGIFISKNPPKARICEEIKLDMPTEICIEKGGVPVLRSFSGNLKDCIINNK